MIGIGTDLVDIDRFRRSLHRSPRLAGRVFTDAERSYAESAVDPAARLAARFAAKEAVVKALGSGRFSYRDVEVVRAETGEPSLLLHGKALDVAAGRGVTRWLLTLSHTDTLAQAVAVAL